MAGAANIQERAGLYRQTGFTAYDPNAPVYTPEQVIAERQRFGIVAPAVPAATETVVTTDPAVPGEAVVSTSTTAIPTTATATSVTPPPVVGAPGRTVVDETYVVPDTFDTDFRRHFDTSFANTGATYEIYRPAYRFGSEIANRPEFRTLSWEAAEPQARTIWEQSNPGSWDRFRTAVQYGWNQAGVRTGNSGATLI
jgi:hypothetical protein